MVNIFIIGSKGIPANYGGFETFVDKLTEYKKNDNIQYYVSCLSHDNKEFVYNNANCFNINVPKIGPAAAVLYDIKAIKRSVEIIKNKRLQNSIIYILACRIGPYINFYKKLLEKEGIKLIINPDGHEWKRSKWNRAIKAYWKLSEKLMVKNSDLLVCDSKGIENYINKEYKIYKPKTTYIAYGADVRRSMIRDDDSRLIDWYNKFNIKNDNYYLIVGRFVPENNYETMIKEFIKSDTKKDLVIITNVTKNKYYEKLKEKTNFNDDSRIKFVGTLYDQELLKKVRENAFAYIHGHEVGGTNPSLLEALASTKLNILLDVIFNKEVAKDSALYFSKEENNLAEIINKAEKLDEKNIQAYSLKSKQKIQQYFSWSYITDNYERLFLEQ